MNSKSVGPTRTFLHVAGSNKCAQNTVSDVFSVFPSLLFNLYSGIDGIFFDFVSNTRQNHLVKYGTIGNHVK